VVIAIAMLVVLPWSLRNQRVLGDFVLVSTNGGFTLLTGNNPSARGGYTTDDPLVESIGRTVATQLQADREAKRRAIQWITQHPAEFLALLPRKFFYLWAPDGEGEWAYQQGYAGYEEYRPWFRAVRILNQAYYFVLLGGFGAALILLGSRVAGGRGRVDWWAVPYALAVNYTLISLVFSGQSRFHYSLTPFMAAACGWLIVVCASREREPR
jgi:hypothetical protein